MMVRCAVGKGKGLLPPTGTCCGKQPFALSCSTASSAESCSRPACDTAADNNVGGGTTQARPQRHQDRVASTACTPAHTSTPREHGLGMRHTAVVGQEEGKLHRESRGRQGRARRRRRRRRLRRLAIAAPRGGVGHHALPRLRGQRLHGGIRAHAAAVAGADVRAQGTEHGVTVLTCLKVPGPPHEISDQVRSDAVADGQQRAAGEPVPPSPACSTAHRRRATREAAHCSIATRNHA
eukprot:COSAG01_NODE_3332_length_6235_cov_3.027678_3_plen_237_part_00